MHLSKSTKSDRPKFHRSGNRIRNYGSNKAQFHSCRITSDATKYFSIVAVLDTSILQQVSDVLRQPPANGKYEALKQQLIQRFTDSREKKIQKLLTEIELDGKKPSQLLREMLTLAGNNLLNDVFRTLWMKRMSVNVRLLLSASEDAKVDKLAQIADRILEAATWTHVMAVEAVSHVARFSHTSPNQPSQKNDHDRLVELERAVTELTTLLKQQLNTSKNENKSTEHSRPRSSSRAKQVDICYYYRRFGPGAKKCTESCIFETPTEQEN